MGARYLTELADWLRGDGLNVVEYGGWQTRGRDSGGFDGDRPWGIVWHHTASRAKPGDDANYMCVHSADAPLANLMIDREGNVWVLAAAATNTNGKGGPWWFSRGQVPKDSMNTHGFGIEMCNDGVGEPFPQVQIDAAFGASLCVQRHLGLDPRDVTTHRRWAPDRKVDPATSWAVRGPWVPGSETTSGTWLLDDLLDELSARAEQEDDDVKVIELRIVGRDAAFLAYKVGDWILWCEWVNGNDPKQLWRLEAYRAGHVEVVTIDPVNLAGVGLIGPIPTGDSRHNWTRSDFGNVLT